MLGVCSIMGLPWFVAATVLSITHVNSLKLESECSAPGEQPKFLGIREQRVTGLMIFILMGSSVFMTSILKVMKSPFVNLRKGRNCLLIFLFSKWAWVTEITLILHIVSRIIITTSELAPLDPLPFTCIYGITKAALEKYAFSLRMETNLFNQSKE